ncbi:MAG: 8-oxo-dGTP diphosphatase [Aerococcus sp.]|nr:8-oxo-dGTP diphosphatase [Aerococcus sp.]
MTKPIDLFLTSLVYLAHDDRLLMMLRNKKSNDINEGKWVGVGGKFEPNESPLECAKREVYEETGCVLDHPKYHGLITFIYPDYPTTYMFLYSGTLTTDQVITNDEGTMSWISKEEVLSLNLWPGDRFFLEKLLAGETGLEMKLRYNADGALIEAVDVSTGTSLLEDG